MPSDSAPPRTGRSGTYAKGVARRQEILDRAIEVFAERGANGTSLRAIAEAIGVSHAALLHYFASREQLLVEVFRAAEDKLRVDKPLPEQGSPVAGMTAAARRNRGVPGLVQLYSTLVASALEEGHDDAQQHFSARFARLRSELTEQVTLEQREGRIRADVDAAAVAALIIGASDGLQIQWLLEPTVAMEDSLELLELLLGA